MLFRSPKAYAENNLKTYLYYRDLHLNNIDILNVYLETFNDKKEDGPQYIQKEVIDFSIFDPKSKYDKSSTSDWLRNIITKF